MLTFRRLIVVASEARNVRNDDDENEGDENRPEYDATSSTEESRSRVGGYERVVHEIDVAPQNGRDIAAVER